ncbi:uncharacterized protein LOC128238627 [Mya arenaria]|uniref:uncharacterized protein LOC128238627 n=1 Tax=Mya arenaria TaxID=6604 RepID=UPI0022E948EC|nr:uncharacterized protein LOC128238627 [Mya arenaria]
MEECVNSGYSVRVPWTAYPRAHYFRKHFNDVHDRLLRILGALPVPLTDDFCLLALEKIRKRLGFDLEVRFLGHHRPPPGEVYVVDPVELRNHVNTSVPEHRTELSHEPPLKINVCYARIHDRNGSLQQNIKHIMEDCDHFEGRSFESERVIIAVDIPPGEHTTDVETELSRHVSNCLPENIPNENILVVLIRRPDKLQLAEAISTYIENMAIDGFETALTLLKKFVTSNRSRLNESFSTYFLNHPVEKCLHMFFHDYDTTNEKPGVRRVPIENMNDLSGQLHIADDLEGAVGGSDEQPEKCVKEDQRQEKATKETDFGCLLDNAGLYTLAGQIKCSVIVDYFSCKYNLPPCNVNDILESTNFKEKFVKSVSSVTKGFIFNYVELTKKGDYGWNHRVQVCVKRGKKPRIKTQRVSLKWLVSKVGHDIQGLVDDYEETMSNVEYIFSLLRKLTFEIEGYLLQGGRTEHQSYIPPPPTIPPEMRKSLLAVNDVYAVCTLYNEPTVLLKATAVVDMDEFTKHSNTKQLLEKACFKETINTIQHIRMKYKYAAALNVEVVSRPFQQFAMNDIEQGDKITASGGGFGTLGGFVQWFGEPYMLTCQHVVGSDSIVKVQKPGFIPPPVIGRATPNMSIKSGTHGVIDIAAVKVVGDVRNRCIPKYKDSDGIFRTSVIYDPEKKDLKPGLNVFKYGASTGLTEGIVASTDFDVDVSNRIVFIESKADFSPGHSSIFSGPGDSGSLILSATFEDGSQRPTLQIISMLTGGLQTTSACGKTVSFQLKPALEIVAEQANMNANLGFVQPGIWSFNDARNTS